MSELTIEQKLEALDRSFDDVTNTITQMEYLRDVILEEQARLAKDRWTQLGVKLNETVVGVEGHEGDFVIIETLGPHWVLVAAVDDEEVLQVEAAQVSTRG